MGSRTIASASPFTSSIASSRATSTDLVTALRTHRQAALLNQVNGGGAMTSMFGIGDDEDQ